MTRKVNGFLTKRGRYFDKKPAAEICDAIEDFNEAMTEYLDSYFLPPMIREFMLEHWRYFILANKEVIGPYIKLVNELPSEPPKNDIRLPTTASVAPSMTDLMVLPESIDDFLKLHPLPEEPNDGDDPQADFLEAFSDDGRGTEITPDGYESVRHAIVPGENDEE